MKITDAVKYCMLTDNKRPKDIARITGAKNPRQITQQLYLKINKVTDLLNFVAACNGAVFVKTSDGTLIQLENDVNVNAQK